MILVIGVTVYLSSQSRYPDASPLARSDLDSLVTSLAGHSLEARSPDSAIVQRTTPSMCGVVAQIETGLTSSSDIVAGGRVQYQVWGSSDRADGPWVNARLFTSPEQALAFIHELAAAVPSCSTYSRPNDSTQWGATSLTRDGDTVRFVLTPYPSIAVFKRYENAVVLLLFKSTTEDRSFTDKIP
ncbi:hypothetical protein [Arthrobacter sp. LjRoot14]|uniref:hypothetical protein n=1 Tax=Arthrobacter sp. LjRoot14 TaxID=3342265 RepID=UPI003F4FE84B